MLKKLAVKKLTASDLTLFEWQFRNIGAGNQKAINLNANVFIDKLYPILPDLAEPRGGKIPVDLSIFGPGKYPLHNLQRKVVKFGTYKNWRLNGEFIHNPDDDPDRYNTLKPGDFAVFEFGGIEFPDSAKLILISASVPEDNTIHQGLAGFMGGGSMKQILVEELESIIEAAAPDDDHPIRNLLIEEDLEDFVVSGDIDYDKFKKQPSLRNVTQEDLRKAQISAEENGNRGEEFVNYYLESCLEVKSIDAFKWSSKQNAISPFDFEYVKDGERMLVDVKSTPGAFERALFISLNELKTMAYSEEVYLIFRIFEMEEGKAKMRQSQPLKQFAEEILNTFLKLPEGVRATGISVSPLTLAFTKEITKLELQLEE